jgi:hypothetical protein
VSEQPKKVDRGNVNRNGLTDPDAPWREALGSLHLLWDLEYSTGKTKEPFRYWLAPRVRQAVEAVRNASVQYAAKGKWVLSQEDERTIEDAALRALRGEP